MRVALNLYRFAGGAPASARHTAAGAAEMEHRIDPKTARRLGLAVYAEPLITARDRRLGPERVRNLKSVSAAVAAHFDRTVISILRGEKPIGIGGDHSMATGTLRASVLGLAVRELLEGSSLPLTGPRAAKMRRAFERARGSEDVLALGRLLDEALDGGALALKTFARFRSRIEVVWIDAHYDLNTPETSFSGNFHGMAASTATGRGPPTIAQYCSKHLSIEPSNFGFVAVREPDDAESSLVERLGMVSFGMQDLEAIGVKGAVRALIKNAETRSRQRTGQPPFLLFQIDIDSLDAPYVPRTGTPVGTGSPRSPDVGLGRDQLVAAVRDLAKDPRVESIDIAELAYCPSDRSHPTLDSGQVVLGAVLGLSAGRRRALFPRP